MFVLEEATVLDIQKALEAGDITSRELVLQYLERIAVYDQQGLKLNSISQINSDAIFIADAMDRERKQGKIRSPLHGIPIVLKENINTHDKMVTSAGSIALKDNYANFDATIVQKLRDAGVVLLGKANMTEMANFMSHNMKNGFSSLGGQVKNPYNPEAEVYGSSSGSAVAVSANLCALAIGTETDGSIIAPSYINGCVGIKPTLGLISRHGVIPIANAQDTTGPMTKSVTDAAYLLTVLVGHDEKDPATWARENEIPKDYGVFLQEDGLEGARIGVNRAILKTERFASISKELDKLSQAAFDVMKEQQAILIEADMEPVTTEGEALTYEFKSSLNAYLAHTNPNTKNKTLKDMIDYYGDHKETGLVYGMSRLLEVEYETTGRLIEPAYLEERIRLLREISKQIDDLFDAHKLDCIVSPAFINIAPISGYPAITVPAGYQKDGTPFGITFVGRPMSEPMLLKIAYAYEQASKKRVAPKLT